MTGLLGPPQASTRLTVKLALFVVTGLSWTCLLFLSVRMGEMGSPFAMPMTSAWTGQDLALMWTMWSVMMAGMMLPSATPMISTYARTIRKGRPGPHGSTGLFIVGYLTIWGAFAVLATGAQWALHDAALVNSVGVATSHWFAGTLLLMAGVYQFSTSKQACLRQCRTPLGFLLKHWRDGRRGALVLGFRHGTLCVGCCWALMAVLFVLGVMNLWWIALVAAVVLVEKLISSHAPTWILGSTLMVWGAVLVVGLAS